MDEPIIAFFGSFATVIYSLEIDTKENIDLIGVMGLAILTARLKDEMQMLKEAILAGVYKRTAAGKEALRRFLDRL